MTPLRPDDVRSARAWASFVAEDAAASAPPTLEARVMRAAKAALAQKQRDDVERRRRQWVAGCTALAASLLAAAAWSLAPHGPTTAAATTPESPTTTTPESSVVRSGETGSIGAPTPESSTPGTPEWDEEPGRPVAMTNVEAGRVLATPPRRLLASRPLFDPADGAGPVDAPARLRAKSFGAPTVEPAFTNGRPTHSIPDQTTPALAAAPPLPRSPLAPPVAATSSEVWSSRSFDGVFDPEAGKKPVPPPIRLDQAVPKPTPHEDPPAPPL